MGVDVSLIQRDTSTQTGVGDVSFTNGQPQYQIRQRVAWDRILVTQQVRQSLEQARAFVFGTLVQRSEGWQARMQSALDSLPAGALRVCDLNLRSPFVSKIVLLTCLQNSDVLKLNIEESSALGQRFGTKDPLGWPLQHSTAKIVVQTKVQDGARILTHDQDFSLAVAPDPTFIPSNKSDTVGAGDAFAAHIVSGLLNAQTLLDAARGANRYASRVTSPPGATPIGSLLLSWSFVADVRMGHSAQCAKLKQEKCSAKTQLNSSESKSKIAEPLTFAPLCVGTAFSSLVKTLVFA